MLASAFFFSLMSALVKALGRTIPSQELVLIRGILTLVFSVAALRAAGTPAWGNRKALLCVRGLLGFGALSAFFYAVVNLPLADATVIHFTNPVFTSIIAALVLTEPIRRRDALSIALSLSGVILIARPEFLFGGGAAALDPVAVAIGLLGAALSAGAYVMVRFLSATEDHMVIVFYFALFTTVGAIPTATPSLVMPTGWAWLGLLGLGITTQLAQVFMTRGLALEPAGRAMSIGYVQILFASAWGVLFFAETPDLWTAAGALLIVAGTATLARSSAAPAAPLPSAVPDA